MRNKNPQIPHDQKNRYSWTFTIDGFDCPVCIIWDACLVDSEDIELVEVAYNDDHADPTLHAAIQNRIDWAVSPLRIALSEVADYKEAHRACQ